MRLLENSTRIQLMLPEVTAEIVDGYVKGGYFSDRQSAVRFLVKLGIDNFDFHSIEVVE